MDVNKIDFGSEIKPIATRFRRGNFVDGGRVIEKDTENFSLVREAKDENLQQMAYSVLYDVSEVSADYLKVKQNLFANIFLQTSVISLSVETFRSYDTEGMDPFTEINEKLDTKVFQIGVSTESLRTLVLYLEKQPESNYIRLTYRTNHFVTTAKREGIFSVRQLSLSPTELSLASLRKEIDSLTLSRTTLIAPEFKWVGKADNTYCNVVFSSVNVQKWVFQLSHILDSTLASSLILNDSTTRWYQKGLQTLGGEKIGLIKLLGLFIPYRNYQKISFIGLSMGAFAAIEYAHYVNVDNVYAFNPDVILGEEGSRSASLFEGTIKQHIDLTNYFNDGIRRTLFFSQRDDYDYSNYIRLRDKQSDNLALQLIDSEHNVGALFENTIEILELLEVYL